MVAMSKTTSPTAEKPIKKAHPIRAIRRAGVPLAAFETSDPAMTIKACIAALEAKAEVTPIMRWDSVRGLVGLNQKGTTAASVVSPDPGMTVNPVECLGSLLKASQGTGSDAKKFTNAICFFMGAHRVVEDVAQAAWNLRDEWKAIGATLIMLCPMIRLPSDLTHDVVVVNEPLPTAEEVGALVDSTAKDADEKTTLDTLKDPAKRQKVIDTLLGMSAFAAEQVFAMSITREGIDFDELWNRKRKMVEQTPGLTVWREASTFDDIGGLDNLKAYLTRLLTSDKNPVRAIGFIDEIEKMFAGAGGDLSGVSQDQLQVFLTAMQNQNIPGMILVGPPGTGKSQIAKCAGSIADAEVLAIDTGAMTGSLVGESQEKIRHAMKTFSAVSQGKGMFIATCNSITSLPPELRRRFRLGTFYIDLPTKAEREKIWPLWLEKFGFDTKAKDRAEVEDDGWTGAEIMSCCDVAYRTGLSLVEASRFIVPVCKSAADKIEALRRMADGRFISASEQGIYKFSDGANAPAVAAGGRKFQRD